MTLEELEQLATLLDRFFDQLSDNNPVAPAVYEVLEEVRDERDSVERISRENHDIRS